MQTLITSDNRDAWQNLANKLGAQYPSVGKRVRVVSGKHTGAEGIVTWHGVDKFHSNYYKSDAQLMLQDMEGRIGFRVCVKTDTGDSIFVNANNVEVQYQ